MVHTKKNEKNKNIVSINFTIPLNMSALKIELIEK
jgi:hypothetical protein